MVKIAGIMQQKTGVGYHRIEIPMAHLGKREDFAITICDGFTEDFSPLQFDVIIVNRVSSQARDYISEAKEAGVKIILDLDDWIHLPEYNANHNGFYTPEIEQRVVHYLGIADVIWCASEYLMYQLADKFDIPVEKLHYIPNAIDFEQPQFQNHKQQMDRYTIGWIGGAGHQHDIEKLGKPLEKLLAQKNYNILLGGASRQDLETNKYWNYIKWVLTSGGKLKNEQFKIIEALDTYNYGFMYNYIDVALAPLCNDIFSKCKSSIKVLEAGAFNLPIIVSNEEPYKEFIREGLVYSSEGNWNGRLRYLIKNPKAGQKMGARLGEYVREYYNIQKINELRRNTIVQLLD